MQKGIILLSVAAFIFAIILLTTSAIGVQRSIECEQYKKSNKNIDTWFAIMIVVSILVMVAAGGGLYLGIKTAPVL